MPIQILFAVFHPKNVFDMMAECRSLRGFIPMNERTNIKLAIILCKLVEYWGEQWDRLSGNKYYLDQ
jgi:hypothetical protein